MEQSSNALQKFAVVVATPGNLRPAVHFIRANSAAAASEEAARLAKPAMGNSASAVAVFTLEQLEAIWRMLDGAP